MGPLSPQTILRNATLSVALLLAAGSALAQNVIDLTAATAAPSVSLTAQRMAATLPDGAIVPMWGYCATGYSLDGGTTTAAPAQTCATQGSAWAPGPTIIVKAGGASAPALTINLNNTLPTPTSLIILGQLGGGLGTPKYIPSPAHAARGTTTWPTNAQGTFTPPAQPNRAMSFGTEVANGTLASLTWTALQPGTYLYETGTHPSIQAPMGLYGVLVVTSEPTAGTTLTPGQAYPGAFPTPTSGAALLSAAGTALLNVGYDAEAVVLMSEIDPGQNASVDAAAILTGCPVGTASTGCGTIDESKYPAAVNYAPTYFLINGNAFSSANLPASAVMMSDAYSTGNVLVRFVNAGLHTHVPSVVGQSLSLIAEDGNVAPGNPKVQSEILLPAGKTVDALITPATNASGTTAATAFLDTAIALFDRELSTSTGNTPNGGMHGFLVLAPPGTPASSLIGTGGLLNALATAGSIKTITSAVGDVTYNVGAKLMSFTGNALSASKGISNASLTTSLSGAPQKVTNTAGQTLVLNPDGSFTLTPALGGFVTNETFTFYGNGSSAFAGTVTVTASGTGGAAIPALNLSFPNPALPGTRFWTPRVSTVIKVPAPGVLADSAIKDAPAHLLGATGLFTTAQVSGTKPSWLTLNEDGSFTAVPCGNPTCPFNYVAVDSLGFASSERTVTLTFPVANAPTVTVADAPTVNSTAPITLTDYSWTLEEDRTWVTTPGVTPPIDPATGLPTATLATSFHRSHMPLVATGCTGPLSCGDAQTVNGGSVTAPNPRSKPSDVMLDPTKRYYLSILPGDSGNAWITGYTGDPLTDTTCLSKGLCGHTMGGTSIPPLATGVTAYSPATVLVERNPLKPAQLSVYIYEDNNPTNGQNDANEVGLGDFEIVVLDVAGRSGDPVGQITYDAFNMPLTNSLLGTPGCPDTHNRQATQTVIAPKFGNLSSALTSQQLAQVAAYITSGTAAPGNLANSLVPRNLRNGARTTWIRTFNADYALALAAAPPSNPIGVVYTCPTYDDVLDPRHQNPLALAGTALIKNLSPGRFDVIAHPGAAREGRGETWYQTETLEGTPGQDAFSKAAEPAYFQEFGSPGFHTTIGFVNPANVALQAANYIRSITAARGPGPALHTVKGKITNLHMSRPVEETLWDSGTYAPLSQTTCLVSLNQGGASAETGLNLGLAQCDKDGNYTISGIPDGQYELFIWDQWLDQIAAFKAVTVAGKDVNVPNVPVFTWFTRVEVSMFTDTNQDGVRDPTEPGISNLAVNMRFRDGSISNVLQTDSNGRATFTELFPLFNWYVTEADTTRYHLGPVNITVDAGGAPDATGANAGFLTSTYKAAPAGQSTSTNRIDPDGTLYEGLQGFIGQTEKIDWARWQFGDYENGGLAGHVVYAATRGFDDPTMLVQNLWSALIPRVTVNLYFETKNADGTTSLALVDTVLTESFDDFADRTGAYAGQPPMQCPGQTPAATNPASYNPLTEDPYVNFTLGTSNQFKCYDGFHMWNQVQQHRYDGVYVFPTGNYPLNDPTRKGPAALYAAKASLLPGKYVVEVVVPPGYEVAKEEDKNILIGDAWVASSAPQFGALNQIYILPDQAVLAQYANANNPGNNNNTRSLGESGLELAFPPCVGRLHRVPDFLSLFPNSGQVAPFAGADKPLCDRKEVTMLEHGAPGADFFLFAQTPVASHFTGLILDDAASEINAAAPDFGEKLALAYAPVSIKDFNGNEVSRIYSDQWGNYNGMLYSSWQVNVPEPAGYSPNMMITCMNDPGPIPDPAGTTDPKTGKVRLITDPMYNPMFSNFCYTNPFMPGMTVYLDTPVLPVAAFADTYGGPDCSYPDSTPAVLRVDGSGATFGPYVRTTGGTLTITALGDQTVPNPSYQGPFATTAPYNAKTVLRHYGFGGSRGTVTLTSAAGNVTTLCSASTQCSWTDARIAASVPALAAGTYQLGITSAAGRNSIDTVTVTVGTATPKYVSTNAGAPASAFKTIQSAIDDATPGDLILLDAGTYNELVILWKPVQLQGVGAASVIINAAKFPTQKLEAWRPEINGLFGLDYVNDPTGNTLVSNPQVDPLPTQTLTGGITLLEPTVLATEEGAAITVLAKQPFDSVSRTGIPCNSKSKSSYTTGSQNKTHLMSESVFTCVPLGTHARIDGITATGGDAGGGIYVNGWAHNLEIANNRVYGNAGALNGGVRVGIPYLEALTAPGSSGFGYNNNVHVHHNAITRNGTVEGTPGTGTAANVTGAGGGLAMCSGADNYLVNYNYICGNYGSGDGGGIGHIGVSQNGVIANNQVLFNQSFQQTAVVNGGGIVVEGEVSGTVALGTGNVTIDSNLIQGNFAETGHGGGIRLQQVNGQDVLDNPGSPNSWYKVTVTNNMIVNNEAGWAGGGIALVDTLNSAIINNTIANNDSVGIAGQILSTNNGTVTGVASPAGISAEPTAQAILVGIEANFNAGTYFSNLGNPRLSNAQLAVVQGDLAAGATAATALTDLNLRNSSAAWRTLFSSDYATALAATNAQLGGYRVSNPVLYNNIVWHNRSFYFSTTATGPALCVAGSPNCGTKLPAATSTGQCTGSPYYWDLGVLGDTSRTPGANHLNPTNSVLSVGTTGYASSNTTSDPQLVKSYCNGGTTIPLAQFEPGAGFLSSFALAPSMSLDEAGNYVNLRYGPLSVFDPATDLQTTVNSTTPATLTPFGNYHISATLSPPLGVAGTAPNLAPKHDVDGDLRPAGTRWDPGADQLP
jgi:hypothetical protein